MNNKDKTKMLEPDDLDLMLARELELDARQSIRTLAGKLATSEPTVKRRLQRLLDEQVIIVATMIDPRLIGFHTAVLAGLNVRPGKADEVVEHLRSYKSVQRIILTAGRYDMTISTYFRNNLELTDFLDRELGQIPYLVRAEKIMLLDNIKTSWKYSSGDTNRDKELTPRYVDEMDRRLIRELELCPRESIKNLGEKLGMNRKIVSRRLQSLLADSFIQVVSHATPSLFGLNLQVFIFLKVQPGKAMSVANSLVPERSLRHICIIAGRFDILLNASFSDLEEMSYFLRNHLGNYPEVLSHEILIQVEFPKRSYSLLT